MAALFEVGDRVITNVPKIPSLHEKTGTVSGVRPFLHSENLNYGVKLDGGRGEFAFSAHELAADPLEDILSSHMAMLDAAIEAAQATHRWTVKTQDNTLGIDVGANAMHIEPSGALVFIIDGRIDIAFAPGYWTEVEYGYEETKTKEEA